MKLADDSTQKSSGCHKVHQPAIIGGAGERIEKYAPEVSRKPAILGF